MQIKPGAKKYLINLVAEIILRVKGFIILPLISNYLGSKPYGIWSQVAAIIIIFSSVATMGLVNSILRYLPNEEMNNVRQKFYSIFWFVLAVCFVISGIIWAFSPTLAKLFFNSENNAIYLKLSAILLTLTAAKYFLLSYFKIKAEIFIYSIVIVAESMLTIVVFVILLMSGYDILHIIAAQILCLFIVLFVVFIVIARDIPVCLPSFVGLTKYLKYGLPTVPSIIIMWVLNSSDKFFIANQYGLDMVGIYSAAYTIGLSAATLIFGPAFVLLPSLVFGRANIDKDINSAIDNLNTILLFSCALVAPMLSALTWFDKDILVFVTNREFIKASIVMPIICGAYIVLYLGDFYVSIMQLHHRTKFMIFTYSLSGIINTVLNFVLIPELGILGAALSTIISLFILSLLHAILSIKFMGRKNPLNLTKCFLIFAIAIFCGLILKIGGLCGLFYQIFISLFVFIFYVILTGITIFGPQLKRIFMNLRFK